MLGQIGKMRSCVPLRALCSMRGKNVEVQVYGQFAKIDINHGFKLHRLAEGPPANAILTKEQACNYYEQMLSVRRIENVVADLYEHKSTSGFCPLHRGQEAYAVGMKAAMRTRDSIITASRCYAWSYLMGMSVHALFSEIIGRVTGTQRGKGGSQMNSYTCNYYGGNGISGAQVPLGTGIALACLYKGAQNVCFTCYDEAAANLSHMFDCFKIADLWDLPVIYVCVNKRYGMTSSSTSSGRASSTQNFYALDDYVPGIWVNGMDVLAVRTATEFAVKYALERGPIIIEIAMTYACEDYSLPNPSSSCVDSVDVRKESHKDDPIGKFKELCLTHSLLSEDDVKTINSRVKRDVDMVAEIAKKDQEDGVIDLNADIYSKCVMPKVRGTVDYTHAHLDNTKARARA